MKAIMMFLLAFVLQIGLFGWSIKTRDRQVSNKRKIYGGLFVALNILFVFGALEWGFRYYGLELFLLLYIGIGMIKKKFGKKAPKPYTTARVVRALITGILMSFMLLVPALLFPEYKDIKTTGSYAVATSSYTYTDESRSESYADDQENRKVSVQFWYPEQADENETFPLVLFSHGSFGYRMSNYSTFQELASNGYVVCSIDHPYHAFYTEHEDGTSVIADMDFLSDVMNISDFEEEKNFSISEEWLTLRTADIHFVLDTILEEAALSDADAVFEMIDTEQIGISGHSLGGAAAAQIGRERSEITSVVCIDGTMLGESLDYQDGAYIMNEEAYPVPLLNFYNQEHYEQIQGFEDTYQNTVASSNAVESYDILIEGSGHLNFTDLPSVSPVLAAMLGTGDVDSRECVETMNQLMLEFFDYTLKDSTDFTPLEKY